jgi:glycosyltransferase involved in cell wall biosynthesis
VSAPRVLVSGLVLDQPMGGVQRHNRELLPRAARLLAEGGGGLALLAPARGLAFELDPRIAVLPSRLPSQPALVRASLERAGLARALAVARARGAPFDLVHTAHLPLPRGLGLPISLLLHDLKHQQGAIVGPARRALGDGVVARALREAAGVLAVSAALRAELLALAPLDPARVTVLPNAADHLRPLPRRPAHDAPLVSVGHIEPRKNLALLLRALALDPGLPRLVLAGAPRGAEDIRLRDLALELGVSARVQFVGLLGDRELCELYAGAACAVFPSLREGFGIPALEAQLALVPVAVSSSAALREVTGPDTPSFAPDDAAACARAIRAALTQSPAQLEAARARAAALTWDASAALLVARWSALARPR